MKSAAAAQPAPAWMGEFFLLSSLWGASFLFMRLGAAEFGPFPTAGLRVALATVFLWPILVHQGQWPALRKHWRPVLLGGLINSAIPFALYAWAVLHITTGLASILNATVPLFGAVVAWLWLGERIGPIPMISSSASGGCARWAWRWGFSAWRCWPGGHRAVPVASRIWRFGLWPPAWARPRATPWQQAMRGAT